MSVTVNGTNGVTFNDATTQSTAGVSTPSTGYAKLPGGLIIQWGKALNVPNVTNTTISFVTAFPTACTTAVITADNFNNAANGTSMVKSTSTTGFVILSQTGVTTNFYWIAMGY